MGSADTAVKSKERLDPRAVELTLRDADDHRPALLDQLACHLLGLLRRDGATEQAQPVLGVTAINRPGLSPHHRECVTGIACEPHLGEWARHGRDDLRSTGVRIITAEGAADLQANARAAPKPCSLASCVQRSIRTACRYPR